MTQKFQDKYRIPSARLQGWDYSKAAAYFITICTDDRINYFGEIADGKMNYSPVGTIAYILWNEIKHHEKNIQLGEFVIMPNHIHMILILDGSSSAVVETFPETSLPTVPPPVPPKTINEFMSSISPVPGSVSTIIRSYKSAVTKYCNRLGFEFKWQTRFYDHIIRNEISFERISNYIKNNPKNWKKDKFNGTNKMKKSSF